MNKRIDMSPESQPEPGEAVILVDRTHPVLGNPYILKNKSDTVARAKVIGQYKQLIARDIEKQGPMFKALVDISERVKSGDKICLQCHCKPSDCHADVIAEKINQMIAKPVSLPTVSTEFKKRTFKF